MSNIIQIKHGNGVPNKILEPYELGYSIDKKSLYIGAPLVDGQKTDAIPVTAEIVEKAKKLEAERTILVNLASDTSEAFDGSKDVSLGVVGILPLKNGGLGVDASQGVLSALGISATATELNYVGGVTSAIQTQLNDKLPKAAETANRVMISNGSKSITTSSITSTELGYLSGVTSNIQDQINGLGGTEITGAASTIATSNLTASRALISNASGKVAVSSVTSTELGYLSGVTSAIQTQLDNKLAKTAGTANRVMISNSSKSITTSSITSTELGYLDGVTSNIQTQINSLSSPLVCETAAAIAISANSTGTFTFSKSVKAVFVTAYASSSAGSTSGFWDLNTSGRQQAMYGYATSNIDTWTTQVTISGTSVTVKRIGSTALYYSVTAFF